MQWETYAIFYFLESFEYSVDSQPTEADKTSEFSPGIPLSSAPTLKTIEVP